MTDQYQSPWGGSRSAEEHARRVAIVVGILVVSALIGFLFLALGFAPAMGAALGVTMVIAAFVRPEWTLILVTILAPLAVQMARIGSLLPGTGLTPINLLMVCAALGAYLQRYSPRGAAAEPTPVDKPLLLLLGWSALSIVTGTVFWFYDPTGIGEWLQFASGYITFWVVRRRWHSPRLAIFAVWVVMAMLFYQSYVVLHQYQGADSSAFAWELKNKIVGTFGLPGGREGSDVVGNSNDTGAYLSAYGAVAFGLFMMLRRNPLRWVALMVFAAAGAATFVTYSRASMISLIAAVLCMTLYRKRRLLLPMIAIVAVLPSVLPASIGNRFADTGDASAQSRKEVWKRGAYVTLRNPIVGVGWRAYSKYQQASGEKLYDPHNMYLLVSAEQGIPGLVFFLGALLGCGKVITNVLSRRNTPFVEGLALGMFGALVAFGINNVFGSRMIYLYIVQHFWLLMGLLVVLAQVRPKDGEATVSIAVEEPEPEPVAIGPPPVSPWRYRSYI